MQPSTNTNRGQAATAARSAARSARLVTAAALLAAAGSASAGVVSWLSPADGNWDEGFNWSTGSQPIATDDVQIAVAGAYTVTVRGVAVAQGLTVSNTGALINIQNARTINVASATEATATLDNNGTIVVNSTFGSSFTPLTVGDADTQGILMSSGGTGEVILNVGNANGDLADATLELNGGAVHATGHTVRGKGRITGTFTNEGLIVADRAGQELRIVADASQSATGVMRATGEGVLSIGQNALVSGGTLTADTLGQILFTAGASTVEGGATIEGPAGVLGGSIAQIGVGGVTNNGTFTVNTSSGTSGTLITLSADATIDGTGTIDLNVGNNNGDLADARLETVAGMTGTLGADQSLNGKGMLVGTWINNGAVEADRDGQELRITADVTQAPGGSIGASNNGVLGLALNGVVSGGMVVTSTGGLVESTAGVSTIDGGLMNLGDMGLRSGTTMIIGAGGIANSGTVTINTNQSTNFTNLRVDETVTIGGTGLIDLNVGDANGDLNDATFSTNTGVTATLASGQTVSGKGLMTGDWISSGTITGDRDGQDLRITGTFDHLSGGEIRGDNGGNAVLFEAAVSGGTFDSDATGSVDVQVGGNSVDGVTSNGNAAIRNGARLDVLSGGFTNNGEVTVNKTQGTSVTRILVTQDATIDGTGSVDLNVGPANGDLSDAMIEADAGVTATNAAGHTIRGKGRLLGEWTNGGTIAADRDTDDLRVEGVVTQAATGVARGDNGGALVFRASTLTGGTTDSSNGGSIQFEHGGNTIDGVTNAGDLGLRSGGFVDLMAGGITNTGTITVNSTVGTSSTRIHTPVGATIDGTGTILLGLGQANGDVNDANIGALDDSVLTLGPGQTIAGKGQLSGNVVVEGTIAPGNPAHSTTISTLSPRASGTGGLLTMAPTTELQVEASAEEVNDRISSTVPVEVAGTLRFTPIDGFDPPRPTRYTIITAPEISGTFDTLIYEGTVPEGGVFRVVYEDDEVIAAVTCKADVAAPIGILDLSDITLFTQLFLMQSPLVDLAPPMGVFDLADITTFVSEFLAGCGE